MNYKYSLDFYDTPDGKWAINLKGPDVPSEFHFRCQKTVNPNWESAQPQIRQMIEVAEELTAIRARGMKEQETRS